MACAMLVVYIHDRHWPLYPAPRVGKWGTMFSMDKIRTMQVNADRAGVDSAPANDQRITRVGRFLRNTKVDELPELVNVVKGEMSIVGPRPNVKRETDLYTPVEWRLLSVKPGITDIASIVFADQAQILDSTRDTGIDYNQRIRPWKSRLGLLYVDHMSLWLDIKLISLTAVAVFWRKVALIGVQGLLQGLHADEAVIKTARRDSELQAFPPPGATEVVTSRVPIGPFESRYS